MTTLITKEDIDNGWGVEVNEGSLEPQEYFKILKTKLSKAQEKDLKAQLQVVAEQIVSAKKIGQTTYLQELAFCYDVLIKEQSLVTLGFDKYVYKDDIRHFIDNVTPKNSIKIIELDRFPRAIPLDVMKTVERLQKMNIFDEMCVVFTDLVIDPKTGEKKGSTNNHQSKSDKKFIQRNRDPIIFGYFKHEQTGIRYDRFYFIDDWEDEYCDLTFSKMIEKMSKMGIENPEKSIRVDHNYVTNLVRDVRKQMDGEPEDKTTFWDRMKKAIGK